MTFGEKLRALRKDARKSQMQVVEEIEELFGKDKSISQTYLSNLELRATPPKDEIVEMLADYYSVPVSYFHVIDDGNTEINRSLTVEYLKNLHNWNHKGDSATPSRERQEGNGDIAKSLKNFAGNYDDEF